LGKFSPSPLFLDFLIAQAVVVGGDIGFERRSALFHAFFLKQLVQECGLGVQLALVCLLVQVSKTLRGEGERATLLDASAAVLHST